VIRALLWDVDGTLAETERDGHLRAFNRAFEALALPWRWSAEHYGELLRVAGGYERLLHDLAQRPEAPLEEGARAALARRVHALKNELYGAIVQRGELPLRAGVLELMADCRTARVPMAIATTTSRVNVEALLRQHLGADWDARFAAVVCAEQAPRKKPHPEVYQCALAALAVAPRQAVAIEDSPAGVEAAEAAGVPVVVTRSHYFGAGPEPAQRVIAVGPSLGTGRGWAPAAASGVARIGLEQIVRWHARGGWE
jgi:HAD superfamily hydrolase (TIGR01509 family)